MLKALTDTILDLIYPPKCAFCGALLEKGEKGVCRECDFAFGRNDFDNSLKGEFFEKGLACFPYSGKVRLSIHRFKFSGRREYALAYSRYLTEVAITDDDMMSCQVITSTPTNRGNVKKRGYDHTALLAEALAKGLELPYIKTLVKTRETKAMFGLRADERRGNVIGSIGLLPEAEQIAGKSVLLVDDIFTTGATASECARVLLSGGASKVFLLTVAKTEK